MRKQDDFLKIKLAGGASAQCLALMNALYLKNKLRRDFKLYYYPHSTGTYWPFAIQFLLNSNELGDSEQQIKGFIAEDNLEIGKIIRAHPLSSRRLSREHILSQIRKLNLERSLQKLRREEALLASFRNLNRVSSRSRAVSGGFVPLSDRKVNEDMDFRFKRSGLKSPFSTNLYLGARPEIVIHFRIGDKRAKFTHPSDFGGDGVSDPKVFKQIIEENGPVNQKKVIVVSDEPLVAQKLLREVGIDAEIPSVTGNLWEDIYLMSQARLFIGSWSQVSQLAAICVAWNGGQAHLPSTTQVGTKISWNIDSTTFYSPKFLEENHWIYSGDFTLDASAHQAYKTNFS